MNYDDILVHLGSFGRWQRFIFFLVCIVSFGNAFITLSQSFVLFVPKYRCWIPECDDVDGQSCRDNDASCHDMHTYDAKYSAWAIPFWGEEERTSRQQVMASCYVFDGKNKTVDGAGVQQCSAENFFTGENHASVCTDHVYDTSEYFNSFVMEKDLAPCQDMGDWPLDPIISKVAFLGMGYMIGMLFGSMLCGYLADHIGRRHTISLMALLSGALSFATAFFDGYWAYFVLRVLVGTFSKGLFLVGTTLSLEISGPDMRMYLAILITIPYAIGEMAAGGLAYFLQDWRHYQMVTSAVVLSTASLWFFLPESPRWLIAEGRVDQARKVLARGAKINKVALPDEVINAPLAEAEDGTGANTLGFMSLFSRTYVARNTLIMMLNWVVTALCFYGLSLNAVNLGGNIYTNFVLSALVEIPSYIFVVLVMDGIGRKPVLVFCQLLAGLACIAAGYVKGDTAILVLSLAGKFGASASFSVVYLLTGELYPTVIRGTALGSCSMVARVGSIIAPILAGLNPPSLPFLIMGTSALVGGILAFFLPEPLGSKLPETLDEIGDLFANSKPWWKWVTNKELRALLQEHQHPGASVSMPGKKTNMVVKVAAPSGTTQDIVNPGFKADAATIDIEDMLTSNLEIDAIASTRSGFIPQIVVEQVESSEDSVDSDSIGKCPMDSDSIGEGPIDSDSTESLGCIDDTVAANNQQPPIGVNNQKVHQMTSAQESHASAEKPENEPQEEIVSDKAIAECQKSSPHQAHSEPKIMPERASDAQAKENAGKGDPDKNQADNSPNGESGPKKPLDPALKRLKQSAAPSETFSKSPLLATMSLPEGTSSRKFSQIAPASADSPLAQRVGPFVMIPTGGPAGPISRIQEARTPEQQGTTAKEGGEEPTDMEIRHAKLVPTLSLPDVPKSRKFSQLAPAPTNSPYAVKLSSKFTMIPTEAGSDKK